MKFHIETVILNVQDFTDNLTPLVCQVLRASSPLHSEEFIFSVSKKYVLWIVQRMIEDFTLCEVMGFNRRDAVFQIPYYVVRSSYPAMERDFAQCLNEAIPVGHMPELVEVTYDHGLLAVSRRDNRRGYRYSRNRQQ